MFTPYVNALMIAALAALIYITPAHARVMVYPRPAEEPVSPDYTVRVKSTAAAAALTPVPVYTSYRFDPASKQTLWGRPVSPISFCSLDADEEVEITVRLESPLADAGIDTNTVIVRPLSLGIKPQVVAGAFSFKINEQPSQVTVEPGGGLLRPLHIFINPIEDAPAPDDANVIYFGPGYHETAGINVKDGQTVYLAGGAVVELKPRSDSERGQPSGRLYGLPTYNGGTLINAKARKKVTVRGRGILMSQGASGGAARQVHRVCLERQPDH